MITPPAPSHRSPPKSAHPTPPIFTHTAGSTKLVSQQKALTQLNSTQLNSTHAFLLRNPITQTKPSASPIDPVVQSLNSRSTQVWCLGKFASWLLLLGVSQVTRGRAEPSPSGAATKRQRSGIYARRDARRGGEVECFHLPSCFLLWHLGWQRNEAWPRAKRDRVPVPTRPKSRAPGAGGPAHRCASPLSVAPCIAPCGGLEAPIPSLLHSNLHLPGSSSCVASFQSFEVLILRLDPFATARDARQGRQIKILSKEIKTFAVGSFTLIPVQASALGKLAEMFSPGALE
jgi:hypothetical protein